VSYPPRHSWIFDINFDKRESVEVKFREHAWLYDSDRELWRCARCEAAITNEYLADQKIVENITNSALDLLWWMGAKYPKPKEHLCPE
jgi:hypothetical protein